jgi:hypothetical protein
MGWLVPRLRSQTVVIDPCSPEFAISKKALPAEEYLKIEELAKRLQLTRTTILNKMTASL